MFSGEFRDRVFRVFTGIERSNLQGSQAVSRRIALIDGANKSIYLKSDAPDNEALEQAVERGVNVKVVKLADEHLDSRSPRQMMVVDGNNILLTSTTHQFILRGSSSLSKVMTRNSQESMRTS